LEGCSHYNINTIRFFKPKFAFESSEQTRNLMNFLKKRMLVIKYRLYNLFYFVMFHTFTIENIFHKYFLSNQ